MTQTTTFQQQEKLASLVKGIEQYALLKPKEYRLRVAGLAILGYAYILCVLLLLFLVIWALRQVIFHTNTDYLIHNLNWITLMAGLGIVRLFWT